MKYSIKVPCLKENLAKIRNFVAGVLRKYDVDDVQANNLVLAVDEVCGNLIIHSYLSKPDEKLEVDVNINQKEITFDIHDHSEGFDIREHPEPVIQEIIKSKRKS